MTFIEPSRYNLDGFTEALHQQGLFVLGCGKPFYKWLLQGAPLAVP
jgi:hypothetical protein